MPRKAIIGGSGFYGLKGLNPIETAWITTEYGDVQVHIYADASDEQFVFLPRHGQEHDVPPHKVNYRANIMALKMLGVERIIAVASVGSLREDVCPGDFVLVDQFIDFTRMRPSTFFDGNDGVVHTDMTYPFCVETRQCVSSNAPEGVKVFSTGTYVCTEGPRFETAAEIRMFAALGGDVVGMTMVPEVVLARELGICYAGVAVVTNYAAGISKVVSHAEVLEAMKQREAVLTKFLIDSVNAIPREQKCSCVNIPGRL